MSDAPEEIGLVGNGLEWRLWNRHEDSDEQYAVRYILRDKHEAELSALKKQVEELTAEREHYRNGMDITGRVSVQNLERALDAEAEAAALRKALEFYADVSKYPAPLTGGMGDLWADCGRIARSALASTRETSDAG